MTPLAQDWLKSRKISLVYTDLSEAPRPAVTGIRTGEAPAAASGGAKFLWWCDGPSGMAKGALSAHRDVNMAGLQTPADAGKTVAAVKELVGAIKGDPSAAGLFFVQSAGLATVYLNRPRQLRAVVGTTLQSLEAAIRAAGPNVLVVEYPTQTLQQMKNLIGRFVKAKRDLSPETRQGLQELSQ